MADKPFQIATQINNYLLGQLNKEEERALLDELEKDVQLQTIVAQYKDGKEVLRRLEAMQRHDLDEAWIKVQRKRQPIVKRMDLRRVGWWTGMAASLVLLIGFFLMFQQKEDHGIVPTASSRHKNDVLPGTDRATLRLSNGESVTLEDKKISLEEKDGTLLGGASGIISYENNDLETDHQIFYNTIEVPRAGTYQVVLPDGSRIWLNALSSLTFPTRFSGMSREVTLTGEAYFEIAADPQKPFKVQVEGSLVTVLGTSFNVNAYEKRMETTLVSGGVKIAHRNVEKELKPGEKAVVKRKDISVRKADLEKVLAWKNGYFHFEDDEISLVLEEIARWYDLEIAFIGVPPKVTFTGGIPRKANLSEALAIIADVSDLQFVIDGRRVTAKPPKL